MSMWQSAQGHFCWLALCLRQSPTDLIIIWTSASSLSSRSFFPPLVHLRAQQKVCFPSKQSSNKRDCWATRVKIKSSLWIELCPPSDSGDVPGALLSPHTGYHQLCSSPEFFCSTFTPVFKVTEWSPLSGLKRKNNAWEKSDNRIVCVAERRSVKATDMRLIWHSNAASSVQKRRICSKVGFFFFFFLAYFICFLLSPWGTHDVKCLSAMSDSCLHSKPQQVGATARQRMLTANCRGMFHTETVEASAQ